MGQRQRVWAEKQTQRLRQLLGLKCARCPAKLNLSFDVIVPVGDYHGRKKEWSWRLSLYRREFDKGNLQLLCGPCNSRKHDNLELQSFELVDCPF